MSRKQSLELAEFEIAQSQAIEKIKKSLMQSGLKASKFQLETLKNNPRIKLETKLTRFQYIRIWELCINDYKANLYLKKKKR